MRRSPIALALLVFVLMTGASPAAQAAPTSRIAFHDDMRKLWEDHITWTRVYIVEALADLPAKGPTAERLLRNQSDIGDAIRPYYGDEAATKLTTLLKEHITLAAQLVDEARAGDAAKKNATNEKWEANADQIASFLSGANSKNWPAAEMKSMMREHLKFTTDEVVANLQKDWKGEIEAYDKVHVQILHMADMLSAGIMKQFPNKFAGPPTGDPMSER